MKLPVPRHRRNTQYNFAMRSSAVAPGEILTGGPACYSNPVMRSAFAFLSVHPEIDSHRILIADEGKIRPIHAGSAFARRIPKYLLRITL
jgi:hypothetical protein